MYHFCLYILTAKSAENNNENSAATILDDSLNSKIKLPLPRLTYISLF
jgi:hypothetical protein